MSTRAHIVVISEDEERYVYHHSDGYLEGVGKELKEFLKYSYDPSDYSADELCQQLEDWNVSYEYENAGIHGDEEYIYYIDIYPDKVIISVETAEYTKTADGDWKETWKEIPEFTETIETNVDSKK